PSRRARRRGSSTPWPGGTCRGPSRRSSARAGRWPGSRGTGACWSWARCTTWRPAGWSSWRTRATRPDPRPRPDHAGAAGVMSRYGGFRAGRPGRACRSGCARLLVTRVGHSPTYTRPAPPSKWVLAVAEGGRREHLGHADAAAAEGPEPLRQRHDPPGRLVEPDAAGVDVRHEVPVGVGVAG